MTITTDLLDPELDADRLRPDPEVDELLVGAIDLHTHPYPSPFPRRMTIVDAARDADAAGFRAIVAKSHHHNTQTDVLALSGQDLGDQGLAGLRVQVFGGVALNHVAGGLNPYIVELCLRMGGKVVWFPTISSAAHIAAHSHGQTGAFPTSGVRLRANPPLSVLDEDGKVSAVVHDILDVIAAENAVLNCGHLPASEIDALIPAAVAGGVASIVVSHPDFLIGGTGHVAEWARQGAVIEHCLAMVRRKVDTPEHLEAFRAELATAGVEHSIFSSDLGQKGNPLPVTVYRQVGRALLDGGVPHADVKAMLGGGNAARLLG